MKKNLILLVALFLMQMVSGAISITTVSKGNTPILSSNTFGTTEIQSNFGYTWASNQYIKIKQTGVYYLKAINTSNIPTDSLKKEIAEGGFIYQIGNNTSDSVIVNESSLLYRIKNLHPNTSYRAIPFIIYDVVTISGNVIMNNGKPLVLNKLVYGKEITFKTRIVKPIITCDISNLTSTSVTLSGKIIGDSITTYGLKIYETIFYPSGRYSSQTITLNKDSSYSYVATPLKPNTSYTFEFFATNSAGTTKKDNTVKTLINADVINNTETNFKVYPNPSNGRFNVSFDNSTPNNIIKIFDLTGKVVYLRELQDTKTEIDLTDKHLKGIYLMKVFNADGVCLSQSKLVLE